MCKSLFDINPLRKTLIFHIGANAGFYSEFNNMILAILYCYKNDINFKIYSKDANFGYKNGWTDFFMPFCEEVKNSFHSVFNFRQPSRYAVYNYRFKLFDVIKPLYHFDYYTYELWNQFHNRNFKKERFFIDGVDMDIHDASGYVISKVWRYNEVVQKIIDEEVNKVGLPDRYVGLHIRRGDKFIEHGEEEIEKYIMKLGQKTDIKDCFVYTDSYEVIEKIRSTYSQYNLFTLVDKNEHGYYHKEFLKKDPEFKRTALLKMFASIDILSRAEYTVGTFSTNPGMFLGMRMAKGKMIGVDYDSWMIW